MNITILGTIIGAAAIMATAGVAFAETGSQGGADKRGGDDGQRPVPTLYSDNNSVRGDDSASRSATSTRVSDDRGGSLEKGDDKGGLLRGSRASDDSGNDVNDDKGAAASSSDDRGKSEDPGFGRGGIRAFLSWIFGLPDSTTVGDLRAQMNASTTASTSSGQGVGPESSGSQGLGSFFKRIFGSFGRFLGGRDD
jgi:hypothetical protein